MLSARHCHSSLTPMKKIIYPVTIAIFSNLVLTQCVVVEEDSTTTSNFPRSGAVAPAYGQPLTAVKGQGRVTIKEGNRILATCVTISPNIEQTRWFRPSIFLL